MTATLQPVPCYWCKGPTQVMVRGFVKPFRVSCSDSSCGCNSPYADTPEEAVQRWNALGERMAGLEANRQWWENEFVRASGVIQALTAEVARLKRVETAALEWSEAWDRDQERGAETAWPIEEAHLHFRSALRAALSTPAAPDGLKDS